MEAVAAGVEAAADVGLVAGMTVAHACAPVHVAPSGVQGGNGPMAAPMTPRQHSMVPPMTPRQQALYVALHRAQVARTEVES